jgi:valyl-tRNA synthetase
LWHSVADIYIEQLKDELRNGNIRVLDSLLKVYQDCLVLIHPFMPFVTDAVWQVFNGEDTSILDVKDRISDAK